MSSARRSRFNQLEEITVVTFMIFFGRACRVIGIVVSTVCMVQFALRMIGSVSSFVIERLELLELAGILGRLEASV